MEQELTNAFCIAVSRSSGIKGELGSLTEPFHCGRAAKKAVDICPFSDLMLSVRFFTCIEDIKKGIIERAVKKLRKACAEAVVYPVARPHVFDRLSGGQNGCLRCFPYAFS